MHDLFGNEPESPKPSEKKLTKKQQRQAAPEIKSFTQPADTNTNDAVELEKAAQMFREVGLIK